TYTFYTGGTSSKSEVHGLYETGGYNNDGAESGNFTAENVVSYVGRQSTMGGGGMHMHGNGDGTYERPDGMPEPPDRNGGHGFKQPHQ
ncbi:MAG: hypothetical protein K2H26_03160, partial [Ruminococcus sp.]|nr:hypothetical protein [Ruminococcus sp.]